ncbi:MAG: PilZ domain-containing protein [Proteobacteria bacterium]|nr:PilZ domain-containing protein [Pseudomonadota bacterium]
MVVERRKYVRFLVQPNTYAALGSRFTKVGKVRDISIGGLAFEYLSNAEDLDQPYSKIAIYQSENKFHLANLPCRVIYDLPQRALNKNLVSNSIYVTNRCAVQFITIAKHQIERLTYFLDHHTQGLPPSSIGMKPPS